MWLVEGCLHQQTNVSMWGRSMWQHFFKRASPHLLAAPRRSYFLSHKPRRTIVAFKPLPLPLSFEITHGSRGESDRKSKVTKRTLMSCRAGHLLPSAGGLPHTSLVLLNVSSCWKGAFSCHGCLIWGSGSWFLLNTQRQWTLNVRVAV